MNSTWIVELLLYQRKLLVKYFPRISDHLFADSSEYALKEHMQLVCAHAFLTNLWESSGGLLSQTYVIVFSILIIQASTSNDHGVLQTLPGAISLFKLLIIFYMFINITLNICSILRLIWPIEKKSGHRLYEPVAYWYQLNRMLIHVDSG